MDYFNVGRKVCHCGQLNSTRIIETETKRLAIFCRCPGCICDGFEYVVGHGAWWIKCICKHSHHEHDNGRGHCQEAAALACALSSTRHLAVCAGRAGKSMRQ